MKKYIDPEKLPQLFREGTDENGDALVSLSEVRKALSLATVEEPVRRGRWLIAINTRRKYAPVSSDMLCSNCRAAVERLDGINYKYCPNCGARMDGEEDAEK